MSATSRTLIEYGMSLRAVCAHSLFETSLTHWLISGSVTTTVWSVICLSYSLPIETSVEVGRANTGAGMLALSIAILSTMTTKRRIGMGSPRKNGVIRTRAGVTRFDAMAELSTSNVRI